MQLSATITVAGFARDLYREVCATFRERTLIALWLHALAETLPVLLHQQVSSHSRLKLLGYFILDERLRFAIVDSVVLAFQSTLDPYKHLRAIGWHGSNRLQMPEEQNAIRSRIGDARKPLQYLAYFIDRTFEPGSQITAKL